MTLPIDMKNLDKIVLVENIIEIADNSWGTHPKVAPDPSIN